MDPEMVSTGPEPSFASFATSPGIASPSVTPRRPQDEAEEDPEEEEDASPPWTTDSPTVPPLPRNL